MPRLIDADALLDSIDKYATEPSKLNDRRWDTRCTAIILDMKGIVKQAPTVTPEQEEFEPSPAGQDDFICGNCGETVGWEEFNCGGISQVKHKFCPWCGKRVKWDD